MTAAVGFPTLRLVRVRVGNIELGKLMPGEVLEINNIEA
jgi:23S rRNA pseudouridine2457 synthase